ncbi:DMT family transporter [Jannaschia formosa]|uniref:DMT family transporter n=1 Tax=Jannaschia formosa TaxID=2259592 RepID=UPI000E1B8829|nr:DMT family transporter [Jannaschia formosa]TFL16979.1 DMT family transporter [Jannaschia formosa]
MSDKPLAAALSILAAMAIIGFIDQFVRLLAEQSSLWTFHLLRSLLMWTIVLAWAVAVRRRLRVVSWRGLAGRSLTISVAMILYFGALGFLPVAQVAAGLFTAPLWILLMSTAFGQRIGPVRIAAVAVGFLGVMLVLAPDPSRLSPLVLAPVLAGAFYGVGALATRAWCAGEGTLELSMGVFTCMGLWGLLGVLVMGTGDGFLTRGWVVPDATVWGVIAIQAVGSLVAVLLLTRGYQLAEASVASIFEYSVLGFSAVFGWFLWGESLGPTGLLGLVLIATAGSVVVLRSERAVA